VIGSQAFGALARMVLVSAKDEGEERRILARAKSNIARDDGGFSYTLEQGEAHSGIFSNRIVWGERIEGSARDILGAVEENEDERGSLRDEARDFLAGLLADGPVNARELKRDAEGAGYSWSTVFRAGSDLKVEKRKLGMKEGWLWALPKNSDDEDFTKISEHGDVKSSGTPEIFDNGTGLPSAPLNGSPEDFRPTEMKSSGSELDCASSPDANGEVWDAV
jgi:putative DNA primase/helicase